MILVNRETRVLVQGITGREGQFHTKQMLSYGTKIVAGVTPGKGGTEVLGIPVYDTVKEAVAHNEVDASIIFVPAPAAADAAPTPGPPRATPGAGRSPRPAGRRS